MILILQPLLNRCLLDHGRRLGEALHHCNVMAWDQQHSSNFSRTANRKILVIVSNGPSEDNPSSAAKTMKDSGKTFFLMY